MKITKYILLFFFSIAISGASAQGTTQVDLQRGEKWWGLYVSGSPAQPFGTPFELTTMQSGGNSFALSVMLSSTGRYVYSDNPVTVKFDGEKFFLTSSDGKVEVQKGGKNLREAYLLCCHRHFAPDGTIPPAEMFSLPHYETEFDPGCFSSQDEIVAYAERLLREGFPPGVLVIADGWDQPNTLYNFSASQFPDPRAMVSRLHELGFKVMLTVTPYSSPYGRHYLDGLANRDFVARRSGKPLLVPVSGGMAVCYDFSKESTASTARENLHRIADQYDIDGFRFECTGLLAAMGEDSPAAGRFLDSWMKLAPETGLNEFLPAVGRQFAPYVTGVAMDSEADHISSAVTALISAGLTGFPYSTVVNLIPAADEVPQNDGLMAEFLLLESAMPVPRVRYAPWRISDPALYEAVKDAITFRAGISNYIDELIDESAKMAAPLLRHMEYVFPRSGFWDCQDQFMLGSRYLFAPAKAGESKRLVRLPKGTWTDRSGRTFKGPLVTEVDCSDGKLIYYTLVK